MPKSKFDFKKVSDAVGKHQKDLLDAVGESETDLRSFVTMFDDDCQFNSRSALRLLCARYIDAFDKYHACLHEFMALSQLSEFFVE